MNGIEEGWDGAPGGKGEEGGVCIHVRKEERGWELTQEEMSAKYECNCGDTLLVIAMPYIMANF